MDAVVHKRCTQGREVVRANIFRVAPLTLLFTLSDLFTLNEAKILLGASRGLKTLQHDSYAVDSALMVRPFTIL